MDLRPDNCNRSQLYPSALSCVSAAVILLLLLQLMQSCSCKQREQLDTVSDTRLTSSLLQTEALNLFQQFSIADTTFSVVQLHTEDARDTTPLLVPAVVRHISARHLAQLADTSQYAALVAVSDSSVSRQLSDYDPAPSPTHTESFYLVVIICLVICFLLLHVLSAKLFHS